MKAEELRLGNWVLKDGEEIELANTAFVNAFHYEEWDKFKPIPLTEEWLIKLGFEVHKTAHTGRMVYWSRCVTIEYLKSGSVWIRILGIKRKDWNICMYVHQLQNLYFALTQNELTIK